MTMNRLTTRVTRVLQMETVIKQTEESMSRKLSAASRLHEDYRPLKAEVDLLRRQCLGLERLPELHEEEGSPVTPESVPHTTHSCVTLHGDYRIRTQYF